VTPFKPKFQPPAPPPPPLGAPAPAAEHDWSGATYRLEVVEGSAGIEAFAPTGSVILAVTDERGLTTSIALDVNQANLIAFHLMAARRYIETHRSGV
jgi:hypothetical protein